MRHESSHRIVSRRLSVFGLDEVGHGLGLGLVVVGTVRALVDVVLAVTVAVAIVYGAVAGSGEPDDNVRVGRVAGAAKVLLVTEGLDNDGVVKRACVGGAVSAAVPGPNRSGTVCNLGRSLSPH
jgi:hypothetical protein